MFKYLGRLAAAHPWEICAAWVVLGVLLAVLAPSWDRRAQDDDIRFLPERCDSVRGYQLLKDAFPQDVFASRIVFAFERPDGNLGDADLTLVDELVADLNRLRESEPRLQINRIISHRDPFIGKRLLSADGKCTLVQVSLGTPYLALQTRETVDRADKVVRERLARSGPNPPELFVTGPAGIGRDLVTASGDSLDSTTIATVILVIVILLAVYRSPLLALIPLVSIAGSVFVALKLLALCTLIPGFYLVNISQIFAVVMLYGAGTDYCLFLISRYREELAQGHPRESALRRSVSRVGGALTASAATVICGLGLMALAEFAKVRSGGPAIAISLAVALAASLTLTPALLRLLGRFVFWPVGEPKREHRGSLPQDLWTRLSDLVVRRPVMIWTVSVLVLLPLALLGTRVKANYRATGELSPTCSSVRGLDVIQRHFTAGEIGPVTILMEAGRDWECREGRAVIGHLTRVFSRLENVAEVRSLTQPLGSVQPELHDPAPPRKDNLFQWGLNSMVNILTEKMNRTAREFYIAELPRAGAATVPQRWVTRLDVVLSSDPFDPRSAHTLEVLQICLRDLLPETAEHFATVRAECYGVTVNTRDLADVTESDRLRINTLVVAGIFLILLALVRRPWLAAYLLVTVLFSYFATLGATTLLAHFWHGRALGEVDWRVPFFLFTILVAVGEDYNILLISRALREKEKHGADEGTRRALARTGGTITSCGLIMAGTFATLMLAGLNTLVQIGFALAFGVLLDTFLVRPFLVPAFVLWVWRRQEAALPTALSAPEEPVAESSRHALERELDEMLDQPPTRKAA
jgi:RND superfamily putative drug exporter